MEALIGVGALLAMLYGVGAFLWAAYLASQEEE